MLLTFYFLTKLFEQDTYSSPAADCKAISATHMHLARQCIIRHSTSASWRQHKSGVTSAPKGTQPASGLAGEQCISSISIPKQLFIPSVATPFSFQLRQVVMQLEQKTGCYHPVKALPLLAGTPLGSSFLWLPITATQGCMKLPQLLYSPHILPNEKKSLISSSGQYKKESMFKA